MTQDDKFRDSIKFRPDVVDYALDLLSGQFHESENIHALLEPFLEELQLLEDTFFDLFVARTLETAEDDALDQLADLVGERRGFLDDDDLRRFVRIKVNSNVSEGDIPSIQSIVQEMADANWVRYVYVGPGEYELYLQVGNHNPENIRDRIASRIVNITAAGFGVSVIEAERDSTAMFDGQEDDRGFDDGVFAQEIRIQD